MTKTLENLAHVLGAAILNRGEMQTEVKQIAFDSRYVTAGGVFFAIKGLEADGHDYLDKACAQGAIALVVQDAAKIKSLQSSVTCLQVQDTRQALAAAANWFYDAPSKSLQVIGITASNGKTSTSLMYKTIALTAGKEIGVVGTVSYETAKRSEMSHLTTPDAVKLEQLLREMADSNYHYAVMECSSIGLDQRRNYGVKYRAAAFNNISREHLDYHGSFANYLQAKMRLITDCADENTAVVLNFDDPVIYEQRAAVKGRLLGFADLSNWPEQRLSQVQREEDRPQVLAADVDLSAGLPHFSILLDCVTAQQLQKAQAAWQTAGRRQIGAYSYYVYPLSLQVPGYHSVMNALSAFSLAIVSGFSPVEACNGLARYQGIERRFQQILAPVKVQGTAWQKVVDYQIYDDHFANPGNIIFSLTSLSKMDYRHLHILYAIRGKRGVTVNKENILQLAPFLPKLRLASFSATLSEDVVGHYDQVQEDELSAFQESMRAINLPYKLYPTLKGAIKAVLPELQQDDVLLLAGCQGMDAGARLCLTELAAQHPDLAAEVIMQAVKDRVCGQANEATDKDKLFAGEASK